MDMVQTSSFLLCCALINYCILLVWFIVFACARDRIFQIHSRWFKISAESFDGIHYAGMGIYKLVIFVFFLVPYLAILLVS